MITVLGKGTETIPLADPLPERHQRLVKRRLRAAKLMP